MPDTAKEKVMEVNDIVDERYHLEKATEVAVNIFCLPKKNSVHGHWLPPLTTEGWLELKKIEEQKVSNYYDLALTEETSPYVFRIFIIKRIIRNPNKYRFSIFNSDLYSQIPSKKIEIDSSINDLADFAKTNGINYKILKIHNPGLRNKKLLNPTKKKNEIEIPTVDY